MHRIQMRYLTSLIERYERERVPTFALNWHVELAHEWLGQVRNE